MAAKQPEIFGRPFFFFFERRNNLKFGNGLFGYIGMETHILAHSSFSHWKEQYVIKA